MKKEYREPLMQILGLDTERMLAQSGKLLQKTEEEADENFEVLTRGRDVNRESYWE